MTDEYRVPEVLRQVREARLLPLKERGEKYAPSALYAMCEATTTDPTALRALYNHVMLEIGFVGEVPEPNFRPYSVCPVCGYVF